MNDKVKCPECGHKNEINSNQCSQCDQELRNYKYFKNDFKDFYKLFSSNNIELLKKLPLTDTGYDSILNSIVEIGNENYHAFPADLNIQNLIRISKPYARVQYDNENKHPGFYSYYSFNKIYLNRNTPYTIIPGAIIHELSHHMFNEIIKQSLMHLLNVEKCLYIESFAWYLTLQNDYLKIANEFASHRTQEYFDPENFNGYSSLNQLLEENDNLDEKKIITSLNVGLSVSKDIIFILEKYVAPTIETNPNLADFHKLGYDIEGFDEQNKLNAMYTIIVQTFEFVAGHKRDMQPILDDLNNNFIRYNV
ncbi:MAG: zinc ribbon domain-containing protein [Methanosphaera sp.]|nr:zinc ribbon domain-containing protein [Methanosphaera sp.]